MENKELKNVFVIVRETVEVKTKLVLLAKNSGFEQLSDFIRNEWRKWL